MPLPTPECIDASNEREILSAIYEAIYELNSAPPEVLFEFLASAGAGSSDNNTATTAGIDTTGAVILVAAVSHVDSSPAAVSDSNGNAWSALPVGTATPLRTSLFWTIPATVGAAHTFTVTSVAGFPAIAVAAFSGPSPLLDQQNGDADSNVAALSTGTVTPTVDDELLVVGLGLSVSTGNAAIDSGFVFADTVDYLGGAHFGVSIGYKIQTVAGIEDPNCTFDAADDAVTRIATFMGA